MDAIEIQAVEQFVKWLSDNNTTLDFAGPTVESESTPGKNWSTSTQPT